MYRGAPPPIDYSKFPKWLVYSIAIGGISLLLYIFIFYGRSNSFTETYSGIVTRKFKDKENNDAITIILHNDQEVRLPFMAKDFTSTINIGDSLRKEKYSLNGFHIKQRNVTITFYYPLSF